MRMNSWLVMFLLTISGCSGPNRFIFPIAAIEGPTEVPVGTAFSVEFVGDRIGSCWKFDRADIVARQWSYDVTFIGNDGPELLSQRRRSADHGIQAAVPSLAQPGTFVVHVHQPGGSILTRNIEIIPAGPAALR